MMTNWYERSINMLQLNGKGERTQEAYTPPCGCSPSSMARPRIESPKRNFRSIFCTAKTSIFGPPTRCGSVTSGIRFFFVHVLQRHWHLFNILRAQTEKHLPAVLSREEVRHLLGCVRTSHNYAFLSTVYSCGLRLQEALHLEVSDIDSQRMMIQVHRGKGAKDRFVPLPQATLKLLRTPWRAHRHPRLLFPALGRDGQSAPAAQHPMAKSSVEACLPQSQVGRRYPQTSGVHPYASSRLRHPSAGSGR